MRLESIKRPASAALAAGVVLSYSLFSLGDEPKGLGRLFRMGNNGGSTSSPSSPALSPAPAPAPASTPPPSYSGQPALSTPPSSSNPGSITPKITPKPRVNKPITEADPLVTRISLGRSDNGSQFGMLLQVFADGTIIDGEGVHRVSPETLKPVVEAVANGDFARLKGHCGGPAGDFIENVHVVVFERSLGRLRASSFSYSGNPQGCDHNVHQLQKVLDELQGKLTPGAPTAASNAPAPFQGLTSPPLPLTSTP